MSGVEEPLVVSPIDGFEVSCIHFLVNQCLLVVLTIYVYCTQEHSNLKEFFKRVWARRWIYGEVTAHLYDTASDVGVLVDWYILANNGIDYNINMEAMFWVSIGFHIWYRFFLCFFTTVSVGGQSQQAYDDGSCGPCCWKVLLSIIDMSIIEQIYISLKHGELEPSTRQEAMGIIEGFTESAPQIVLQCIFLARSYSDPSLAEDGNSTLVIISLVASILSISSKYATLDASAASEDAIESEFEWKRCKEFPNCFSFKYLLRIIWRFSFLVARLFLLVCIWLVLGGTVFAIFISVTTCIWCVCIMRMYEGEGCCDGSCYYIGCVACIANPMVKTKRINCYHFYEMFTWLTLVTVIGFMDEIPDEYNDACDFCADDEDRIVNGNPYTEGFIYIAWCAFVMDFVLFFILYKTEVIEIGDGKYEAELEILFEIFPAGQSYTPGVDNQPSGGDTSGDKTTKAAKNEVELHVQQQIDNNTVPTTGGGIPSDIKCICGGQLSVYDQLPQAGEEYACDMCKQEIWLVARGSQMWHCNDVDHPNHEYGFDICQNCIKDYDPILAANLYG